MVAVYRGAVRGVNRGLVLLIGAWALPANAATLTGTVTWSATIAPQRASVTRDAHVCGAETPVLARFAQTQGRGVADVLLYADKGPRAARAPRTELIDQVNCGFVPRLVALRVGDKIRFGNSDPVFHGVRLINPAGQTVATYAMPIAGQKTHPLRLDKPGRYEVRCDAGHHWMRAFIFVFDHDAFTLSGPNGQFVLPLLPGTQRISAWHPDLGPLEASVDASTLKADLHYQQSSW